MKRQKSFEQQQPSLYVVATPIGNLQEFTPRAVEVLKNVDVIAAEDTRNTRKLLQYFDIHTKLIAHHQHNEVTSAKGILALLEEGKNVAIVSDAGYPLISDPGQTLTQMVLEKEYPIIPISGANAALNALVASGICPQPFLFYGFLNAQRKERAKQLDDLKDYPMTLIFYEAPHRIHKTLEHMLEVFGNRKLCLARELTKRHEEFLRGTIKEILEVCEECKGEMVLVVEGKSKEDIPVESVDIHAYIHSYIENGYTPKEAIRKVANDHGLSKNDVYRKFHGLN